MKDDICTAKARLWLHFCFETMKYEIPRGVGRFLCKYGEVWAVSRSMSPPGIQSDTLGGGPL